MGVWKRILSEPYEAPAIFAGAPHSTSRTNEIEAAMATIKQFLAVPNRKGPVTGTELDELAKEAESDPNIEGVSVQKSSLTFRATPEAVEQLKKKFAKRVIIEQDKPIFPLR
jgi:hypothetical protein